MSRKILIKLMLLVCLAFSATVPAQTGPSEPLADKTIKIGVFGASVSAGYGSDYNLAEAIGAAMKVRHEVVDSADNFFFFNHKTSTPKIVAKMKEAGVDVLIGLDYLFWFASGKKSLDQRKADVEAAIAFLDDLKMPILIGTIPAMKNVSRRMLRRERIIPPDDVPVLNDLLKKLIKDKKNIHLIPLATWIEKLNADEKVPGIERVSDKQLGREDLFLKDGLHLNRTGLVFGAAMIIADLKGRQLILNDANARHRVSEIIEVLATRESNITLEVRGPDGKFVKDGILRFDLPGFRELTKAGLSMDDIVKLKSLDKYSKPQSLKDNNPFKISGIPPVAAGLSIQVRAESDDFNIGPWVTIPLAAAKNTEPRKILLQAPQSIRLRVLDGDGNPIAGATVHSQTAAAECGFGRSSRLPESFTAQGKTDANGIVVIRGIGPEKQQISIKPPSMPKIVREFAPSAETQVCTCDSKRK